jgi:thiamine biosynthesis protein ThiS
MARTVNIVVDGLPEAVPAGTTLAQLIQRHQAQHKDLIVELDGRFVPAHDYERVQVEEGSRVEFILPAFGG